jgi:hypothetical protein
MRYTVHTVPGRLRIKIPELKGNGLSSSTLEQALLRMEGVRSASVKRTTGSVVVCYNPNTFTAEAVLAVIAAEGHIELVPTVTNKGKPHWVIRASKGAAKICAGVAVEAALRVLFRYLPFPSAAVLLVRARPNSSLSTAAEDYVKRLLSPLL